jgi:hypothetical protein
MSRYSLAPNKNGYKVDVGYDAQVDSYFLQVRMPNERGDAHLVTWRGNGVVDFGAEGIVSIPEVILTDAAQYATVPDDLLGALLADRDPAPEDVSSEAVVYAGMPNKEVWRYRTTIDPSNGTQMRLKPSSRYSFCQRLAMAILRDFLRNDDRALRIMRGISATVMSKLIEKRSWILTERDMNGAVLEAENVLGLRWLPESKCYAGEGVRVDAEMQLRRASRKRHAASSGPVEQLAIV